MIKDIQQATIHLFSQKKYRDISMEEIARLSHITKGTLYKYFPSKIALFVSIFESYLRHFMTGEMMMTYAGMSYREALAAMFQRLYEFTRDNRGFMRLFWMLNSDTLDGEIPEELLGRIHTLNVTIIELTARCLEGKKCSGMLGDIHPILVTHLLSAMNKGLFMQVDKEKGFDIPSVSEDKLFDLMRKVLLFCADEGGS
jgi:TetR/AcrR family fatty acid metabolism transcriptional regulator